MIVEMSTGTEYFALTDKQLRAVADWMTRDLGMGWTHEEYLAYDLAEMIHKEQIRRHKSAE